MGRSNQAENWGTGTPRVTSKWHDDTINSVGNPEAKPGLKTPGAWQNHKNLIEARRSIFSLKMQSSLVEG
jgi:hypothetical protein